MVTLGTLVLMEDFRWPHEMKIRRARKDNVCDMPRRIWSQATIRAEVFRSWDGGPVPSDHTPVIPAGTLYVEYVGGVSDVPFGSGPRYCAACAIAAGIARRKVVNK